MKQNTAVRISERSHGMLRDLAKKRGESMQAVLDEILEGYRRLCFLDECDAAYATLLENPEAWSQYQAEIRSFDNTLMDGLGPPPASDKDSADA